MSELRGRGGVSRAPRRALVEAAEQISGVTGALVPVVQHGTATGDALEDRVAEAVGAGPAVVFVDLASGSCLFAVLNRLRASQRSPRS